MQIKSIVETPDGTVQVEANLTPDQAKFLIEVGLNVVMRNGAELFSQKDEFIPAQVMPFEGATQ